MSDIYLKSVLAPAHKTRLSGGRNWPAIGRPPATLEGLQTVVDALRERAEVQARERTEIRQSFTTVQDLISLRLLDAQGLGRMESRLGALEDIDTGITTVADLITAINELIAALRGET